MPPPTWGTRSPSDPSLPDAYTDLASLADRAGDAEALFPLTGRLYTGTVAARSYLMYRAGHVDEAFHLLCRVAAAEPGRPWATGWLAGPGSPVAVAGRLELRPGRLPVADAAGARPAVAGAAGNWPSRSTRSWPWRGRSPPGSRMTRSLLAPLSGLARRLGAYDEAIGWCRRAEQSGGGPMAAVMLGYALRDAGRPDGRIPPGSARSASTRPMSTCASTSPSCFRERARARG